jgi:hypothetical protein
MTSFYYYNDINNYIIIIKIERNHYVVVSQE